MAVQWPGSESIRPGQSVVIYYGTGELDLTRCMRYVEEHGLNVEAMTQDWPTAVSMVRRGVVDHILVAPGDEHRHHEDVVVAGPPDMPQPAGSITHDDVRLIRKLIALGESTQEIVRRVTQRRRRGC